MKRNCIWEYSHKNKQQKTVTQKQDNLTKDLIPSNNTRSTWVLSKHTHTFTHKIQVLHMKKLGRKLFRLLLFATTHLHMVAHVAFATKFLGAVKFLWSVRVVLACWWFDWRCVYFDKNKLWWDFLMVNKIRSLV